MMFIPNECTICYSLDPYSVQRVRTLALSTIYNYYELWFYAIEPLLSIDVLKIVASEGIWLCSESTSGLPMHALWMLHM